MKRIFLFDVIIGLVLILIGAVISIMISEAIENYDEHRKTTVSDIRERCLKMCEPYVAIGWRASNSSTCICSFEKGNR